MVKFSGSGEDKLTSGTRVALGVTLAVVLSVLAVGCGGEQGASTGQGSETPSSTEQRPDDEKTDRGERGEGRAAEETTGATVESETRAGAEAAGAEAGAGDEGRGGEATLTMDGEPGTAFSGTCAVGEEEREVSGEVPQEFGFALDGRELNCEIRKEGAGNLEIVFAAGNDRSVHRTNATDATVRLVYSGNGISFSSSSSSSSSSSVVQQSSSSSSSSVIQQSSSSSQGSR